MANKWAKAVAMTAMLGAVPGAKSVDAQEIPRPRLVLHLSNLADVPAPALQAAQALVDQAYARTGVQVEWADVEEPTDPDGPGVRNLTIIIAAPFGADRKNRHAGTLGTSGRVSGRAWVYYARIVRHAELHTLAPASLLALVIAHEVGHLLLPERSHVNQGIMRPKPPEWLYPFPAFVGWQADAIHRSVANAPSSRGFQSSD